MVAADIGPVKLYYFDFGDFSKDLPDDCGRGENVKLFLEDAGISYEYLLTKWSDWNRVRCEWVANGFLTGSLPVLETKNGKKYFMTVPILSFLSKKLGQYYGKNLDEEHMVDVVADLTNDFYDSFVHNYWLRSDKRENHRKNEVPLHINRLERFYEATAGPYLLGSEISFADFQVYHVICDEEVAELPPHLTNFVKNFKQRPNIKNYLDKKKKN
ncbi:glutathione S-transferase [Circinella umbellata]|nr:glutathione S-transferase [Circinella umbellata]